MSGAAQRKRKRSRAKRAAQVAARHTKRVPTSYIPTGANEAAIAGGWVFIWWNISRRIGIPFIYSARGYYIVNLIFSLMGVTHASLSRQKFYTGEYYGRVNRVAEGVMGPHSFMMGIYLFWIIALSIDTDGEEHENLSEILMWTSFAISTVLSLAIERFVDPPHARYQYEVARTDVKKLQEGKDGEGLEGEAGGEMTIPLQKFRLLEQYAREMHNPSRYPDKKLYNQLMMGWRITQSASRHSLSFEIFHWLLEFFPFLSSMKNNQGSTLAFLTIGFLAGGGVRLAKEKQIPYARHGEEFLTTLRRFVLVFLALVNSGLGWSAMINDTWTSEEGNFNPSPGVWAFVALVWMYCMYISLKKTMGAFSLNQLVESTPFFIDKFNSNFTPREGAIKVVVRPQGDDSVEPMVFYFDKARYDELGLVKQFIKDLLHKHRDNNGHVSDIEMEVEGEPSSSPSPGLGSSSG